jgi:hypothetical protein
MENQQAINVLIQVANLAQSKGLLSLDEAVIVSQSVKQLQEKKEDEPTAV